MSAAERLVTESYNKLISAEIRPFKIIEILRTTITTDEDGVRNTVSVDQATLVPLARFAEGQLVFTPDETVDQRDDKVDEGGGRTTAE